MISEVYIDKEIMPLLLKAKYPLRKVIKQDFRPVYYTKDFNDEGWQDCDAYYIPTQAQVMKWLREVQNIIITIDYDKYELPSNKFKVGYGYSIQKTDNPTEYFKIGEFVYDTYEDAVEAAIKYCLENLI